MLKWSFSSDRPVLGYQHHCCNRVIIIVYTARAWPIIELPRSRERERERLSSEHGAPASRLSLVRFEFFFFPPVCCLLGAMPPDCCCCSPIATLSLSPSHWVSFPLVCAFDPPPPPAAALTDRALMTCHVPFLPSDRRGCPASFLVS